MFNQVNVFPDDADALRFLWWDTTLSQPPKEYQMLVHIFGATSSPCCANRANDNKNQEDPEVIKTVHRHFFVDDVLKSVPTTERAIWLAEKLTKLLTKFASTSQSTSPRGPSARPTSEPIYQSQPTSRRVRTWIALGRCFRYFSLSSRSSPQKKKTASKRGIHSTVSSLYDPLGFVGLFLLPVKVILQELSRIAVQWAILYQSLH